MSKHPASMSSKTASAPAYYDDLAAVPMLATRSDYDYDDAPELPSYDNSVATDPAPFHPTVTGRHGLSREDTYAPIQPVESDGWRVRPEAKVTEYPETTARMDERLNDPDTLYDYINNYLRLVPPKPTVRIEGWHNQTVDRNKKKETEKVVDFGIVFNLQAWLPTATPNDHSHGGETAWRPRVAANGDLTHRGGWRKAQQAGCSGDTEVSSETPALADWCEDFCRSKATLKVFRIARDVPGLDQAFLQDRLERLVRSTNYRGHVDITFPIGNRNVDIYSPHVINRWRTSWVRYVFYFSFLWIITWPILLFATKRWQVYKVDWCWSYKRNAGSRQQTKHYAAITEQDWFTRHAKAIRSLIIEGYRGDATAMPLDLPGDDRREENGRTPQTGNANLDAVVSVIQSGMTAWGAVARDPGQAPGGWGGDYS